jgi:hypothetical protein
MNLSIKDFFPPEIQDSNIILYIDAEIFENKMKYFVYEHWCKIWLNLAMNAIFRK